MKQYLFIIGLGLLLTGCKYEQNTYNNKSKDAIVVNAKITQTKVSASTISKAGEWETGDAIGMYIKNGYGYNVGNIQHTWDGTKFTSLTGLFYDSYSSHTVAGVYPYDIASSEQMTDLYNFNIKGDQSTKVNYTSCDLMHDVIANQVPQLESSNTVKMDFKHRLSNVRVKLLNYGNEPFVGNEPPIVKIVNTNKAVQLNLQDGTITANATKDVADISMLLLTPYSSNSLSELEYVAIAAPQTIASASQLFYIEIPGGGTSATYTVTLGNEFTLVSGSEHLFTITNNGVPITIGGGEVQPWTVGPTLNGDAGGDGVKPSTLNFTFTTPVSNIENVKTVELIVDGVTFVALRATWDAVNSKLIVKYDQGKNWGYQLESLVVKDVAGTVLANFTGLTKEILGDPTIENYDKIINID